jgi:hypothetical protein
MNKKCKRCEVEKPTIEFGDNKNNKDGKSIYCKKCELERGREYREKNREKVNDSSKNYRKNNPEKYKEVIEKYLGKNPNMTSTERIKKYREKEEWREKFKIWNKKWKLKKIKEDGFYRMKINLRRRIREYLIGESKGIRTKEIVGLDKMEFKLYIQNKFVDGMSWENYGKWHLDHIKPLCMAKDNEEALLLNHHTNLQPLWAEDNLKKGKKI